jgi:hypothetical protein
VYASVYVVDAFVYLQLILGYGRISPAYMCMQCICIVSLLVVVYVEVGVW